MDDGQYVAISGYLEYGTHTAEFTKSHKFVLRRSCKNYKLVKEKLYYKEQIQDRSDRDRLVVKRSTKTDGVFPECHFTAGVHRGRGATVGKVTRYY